jgi:hypothetical protein
MTDRSSEIRSTGAPAPFRSTRAPAPLREDQIEVLRSYGQTRETEAGAMRTPFDLLVFQRKGRGMQPGHRRAPDPGGDGIRIGPEPLS